MANHKKDKFFNKFMDVVLISLLSIFIYRTLNILLPDNKIAKEREHTVMAVQVVRAFNLALYAEVKLYNDTMDGKWSKKKVKEANRLIRNAKNIVDTYNKTVKGE
jgi:hypothetical protein